jgi:hypothetical protein
VEGETLDYWRADHDALHETAVGWMILLWNSIIDCFRDVREYKEYLAAENDDLKEIALTNRISVMLASFGKMPTTSARRLTSLLRRSSGAGQHHQSLF